MLTTTALVVSLCTSFMTFAGLMLAFLVISSDPANAAIHNRKKKKSKVEDEDDSPASLLLHAWSMLRNIFTATEHDIAVGTGIDSAVYLISLFTCFKICLWSSLFGLLILLPFCLMGGYLSNPSWDNFNATTMANIAPGSPTLWIFVLGSYWVTGWCIWLLLEAYISITDLRGKYESSNRVRPEQYTILCQDIPRVETKNYIQFVDCYFRELHPENYSGCLLIRDITEAQKIEKKLKDARKELLRAKHLSPEPEVEEVELPELDLGGDSDNDSKTKPDSVTSQVSQTTVSTGQETQITVSTVEGTQTTQTATSTTQNLDVQAAVSSGISAVESEVASEVSAGISAIESELSTEIASVKTKSKALLQTAASTLKTKALDDLKSGNLADLQAALSSVLMSTATDEAEIVTEAAAEVAKEAEEQITGAIEGIGNAVVTAATSAVSAEAQVISDTFTKVEEKVAAAASKTIKVAQDLEAKAEDSFLNFLGRFLPSSAVSAVKNAVDSAEAKVAEAGESAAAQLAAAEKSAEATAKSSAMNYLLNMFPFLKMFQSQLSSVTGVAATTSESTTAVLEIDESAVAALEKTIAELETDLAELAKSLASDQSYAPAALIIFSSRREAAEASTAIHANRLDHFRVCPAPAPAELIWENARLDMLTTWSRMLVGLVITIGGIFFYQGPVTFISSFSDTSGIAELFPFLSPILGISWVQTLIASYVPSYGLSYLTTRLPQLLFQVAYFQGYPGQSSVMRSVVSKKFVYSVASEFIGVTLSASLSSVLTAVLYSPSTIAEVLGEALPSTVTFFMSYIILEATVSNGLEAAQLDDYFLYWAEKKYLGITPSSGTTGAESGGVTTGGTGGNSSSSSEAESQILEDKNFDFVVEIPKDLLIMVIAMGYSIIAPAVMPCAALYFIICWFCFKHQCLTTLTQPHESAGKMWPLIHNCILGALIVGQLSLTGFLGLKTFVGTPLVAILPLITGVYWYYCDTTFVPLYTITCLEIAHRKVPKELEVDDIFKDYVPSCLKSVEEDMLSNYKANWGTTV